MDATEPRPFELAPPPPPRPIQWRRAGRLLRELIRAPEQTEKVFELFEAAGGRGDERTVQAFAAHPEGQRLFAEKPCLVEALSDRKALGALPPSSFGAAYLAFANRNGFAADGLIRASEPGLGELNERLDPERQWFFDRVKLIHDLWHVLTGYDTDPAGEAALLAFSVAQGLRSRSLRLLLAAALVVGSKREGFAFQRFLLEARRRGRLAAPLFVQRYEELLPRPLVQVRRELRIQSVREAHPGGIFRAAAGSFEARRVTT